MSNSAEIRIRPGRFWSKVDIQGQDECWNWLGSKHRDGYGKCGFKGKHVSAHRKAYELTYGSIPVGSGYHGTVIRHKCDNKLCCNPTHLEMGTIADNNQDTIIRGRHRYKSPSLKGESNPLAKLNTQDVLQILALYRVGNITQTELGKMFSVTQSAIYRIVHKKNWRWLTDEA